MLAFARTRMHALLALPLLGPMHLLCTLLHTPPLALLSLPHVSFFLRLFSLLSRRPPPSTCTAHRHQHPNPCIRTCTRTGTHILTILKGLPEIILSTDPLAPFLLDKLQRVQVQTEDDVDLQKSHDQQPCYLDSIVKMLSLWGSLI